MCTEIPVDIVHHAAIGIAGFLTLQAAGAELAGVAFVAGSVVPDLDVLAAIAGRRAYLRNHQKLTHSVLLAPAYASGIALLLAAVVDGWSSAVFAAALAGIWIHSMLDLSNTFGVALFAPWSSRRSSLDAVFFVDAIAWALTLFTLAALCIWKNAWIGASYAGVLSFYLALRWRQHRHVRQTIGCQLAIPSSWNPFEYFTFSETYVYRISIYNAATGRERSVSEIKPVAPEIAALADQSSTYRDLRTIARALRITEARSTPNGTTLVARDLAVRNFGGRFARTELLFDSAGKLLHETAAI
jgi:membrane-bound metal-dependent hydrolase YbcI (DUF457 family)